MALAIPVVAGSMPVAATAAEAPAPVAVENFAYPDAAKVPVDLNVTLKSGDGNIRLADCTSQENLLVVWSLATEPNNRCFRVTGPSGFLSMEIPKVFSIKGDDHVVKATLTSEGNTSTVDIEKNLNTPVGAGTNSSPTVLLELNASGGTSAPQATSDYPAVGTLTVGTAGRAASRGCTATVVDPLWALTSAGCFTDNPASLAAGAPAAKSTLVVGGTSVDVAEIVPRTDRDLALVRLAVPVRGVTPVKLATTAPAANENLRVIGNGRTATDWIPAKPHATTHTTGAVTATSVDTVPASGSAAVCAGDAGAPLLRDAGGSVAIVAVASRSWQGGCLGTPSGETRTGASNSRTDDIAAWVQQTVAKWSTAVSSASAIVNSVYNPDSKTAEIFSLGTDGILAHNSNSEGKGWSGWSSLDDNWRFAGIPATVYNPSTGATELFAIRTNGELAHNYWTRATGWGGWSTITSGWYLTGSPIAVYNSYTKTAEVFAIGASDGRMAHSWSTNGARWEPLALLGDWAFKGTPTVVYNSGTNAVELFAVNTWGDLSHNYWAASDPKWHPWSSIGSTKFTGSPTAVVNPTNNSAEVFVVTDTGAMAHSYSVNGDLWREPTTIGSGSFNGTPAAVFNPAANAVELFAIRKTGELAHNYWTSTTGWNTWSNMGDWKFTSTPSATYNAYVNTLELFALGTNGVMNHSYYENNIWKGWYDMPGWKFATN
ncbi:trypsin-like serine protease [Kitasatospora sp. NPDC098663]|uniref:trypsin-like serine protease n=1 Tax=Kitasatospora sp. NPDC098663 TaxID=3364096 RepID=UPI0037FCAB37